MSLLPFSTIERNDVDSPDALARSASAQPLAVRAARRRAPRPSIATRCVGIAVAPRRHQPVVSVQIIESRLRISYGVRASHNRIRGMTVSDRRVLRALVGAAVVGLVAGSLALSSAAGASPAAVSG